jgi:hypothetical protein
MSRGTRFQRETTTRIRKSHALKGVPPAGGLSTAWFGYIERVTRLFFKA